MRDMSYLTHALSTGLTREKCHEVMLRLSRPSASIQNLEGVDCQIYDCVMMAYMRMNESCNVNVFLSNYVANIARESNGNVDSIAEGMSRLVFLVCNKGGNTEQVRKLFDYSTILMWLYYTHERSLE